jgi:hypothetical protein
MDRQFKRENRELTGNDNEPTDTTTNTDTNAIDSEQSDFIGRKINSDNPETIATSIGEITGETKRGRGRPKGSRNKNRTGETIGLQTEAVTGSSKEYKTKKPRFMSEQDAENTSNFILSTIQSIAVETMGLGEPAQLNQVESLLLSLSLPKYLSSIELSTIENGAKFMYPLAAILGASMYGLRIGAMYIEKRKETKEQETSASDDTTFSDNGKQENNGSINWNNKQIDMSKYNRSI